MPQLQALDLVREVAKVHTQHAAKHFAKPLVQWKESIREVPQVTVKEQLQEVPQPRTVEVVREVPKPELPLVLLVF